MVVLLPVAMMIAVATPAAAGPNPEQIELDRNWLLQQSLAAQPRTSGEGESPYKRARSAELELESGATARVVLDRHDKHSSVDVVDVMADDWPTTRGPDEVTVLLENSSRSRFASASRNPAWYYLSGLADAAGWKVYDPIVNVMSEEVRKTAVERGADDDQLLAAMSVWLRPELRQLAADDLRQPLSGQSPEVQETFRVLEMYDFGRTAEDLFAAMQRVRAATPDVLAPEAVTAVADALTDISNELSSERIAAILARHPGNDVLALVGLDHGPAFGLPASVSPQLRIPETGFAAGARRADANAATAAPDLGLHIVTNPGAADVGGQALINQGAPDVGGEMLVNRGAPDVGGDVLTNPGADPRGEVVGPAAECVSGTPGAAGASLSSAPCLALGPTVNASVVGAGDEGGRLRAQEVADREEQQRVERAARDQAQIDQLAADQALQQNVVADTLAAHEAAVVEGAAYTVDRDRRLAEEAEAQRQAEEAAEAERLAQEERERNPEGQYEGPAARPETRPEEDWEPQGQWTPEGDDAEGERGTEPQGTWQPAPSGGVVALPDDDKPDPQPIEQDPRILQGYTESDIYREDHPEEFTRPESQAQPQTGFTSTYGAGNPINTHPSISNTGKAAPEDERGSHLINTGGGFHVIGLDG